MMNIMVVGRGWVGKLLTEKLIARGNSVSLISHTEIHAVNFTNRYDWVINCAGVTGYPNVDACEFNKKNTFDGNTIFPIKLQKLCEREGIRFAHFSSGCIYEGVIESVHDEPNYFGSTYSISKGISDTILKNVAQVYRIRMPFTNEFTHKNYLYKIHKYATTGKLIEGGLNSLTDLDEALSVVCHLIESNAPNDPYNLVNDGAITMHELVDMMGLEPMWYTDDEFAKVTVAKRSNCVIPAYHMMSSLHDKLLNTISTLQTL